MGVFIDKVNLDNFSIEKLDVSEIDRMEGFLPKNGIIDLNIAERGLVYTLEGQNLCQEKIAQVERWIGFSETRKNKAWSDAALNKASVSNIKTAKEKDWFAQADEDYINACNNLTLAKACKKWLENKAGYFNSWHYAFKTFLRRDYSLENSSAQPNIFPDDAYNITVSQEPSASGDDLEICGDISWG